MFGAGRVARISEVAEYGGQARIALAATQLGDRTPAQARRIVAEWVEFFSAGPTPVRELEFVSRTPERLFAALASQTQLRRLVLKWGDYADLAPLQGMAGLEELRLRGASSVRTLDPLAGLTSVRTLQVESLRHVHVLDPLAGMTSVTDLEVGGDWMAPRAVHVDSIGFLRAMPQLEQLLLHTLIVDDHDYTPILDLRRLRTVRVKETRGMRPPFEELKAATPWRS